MDRFMRLAWKEAEASAKEGGIRCGAVMVLDGEVVVRTRDRTVQTNHHQPLAHAAMETFRHASLRNDWNKATLVTTHSLCWMCVGMVLQFNVGHVMCGAAPADKKQTEAIAYLRERGVTVELLYLPEFVATPGGCPPPEEMINHTECTPLCSEDKALEAAYLQAEKSYNEGGVPVGASMAVDGQVIARGHNRRVQDGNPTSHGETQCFTNSGGNVEWTKSTLYTTLSPCMLCTGSVLHLGIPKVVIGENKTFGGNEELLRKHGVDVVILEDQKCYDIMQRFVQERPDIWNGDIGENNE